jgi:hypothetical protein
VTDTALLITNDHQRCETESAAAFHHFGDAVDANQLFDKFGLIPVVVAAIIPAIVPPAFLCHAYASL